MKTSGWGKWLVGLAAVAIAGTVATRGSETEKSPEATTFIVQAASAAEAERVVERAGGVVVGELSIIRSVVAELTAGQRGSVSRSARLYANGEAELTGKGGKGGAGKSKVVETYYPTHLGADLVHALGIDGSGVTVAMLDSGVFGDSGLVKDSSGENRVLAHYDATARSLSGGASIGDDEYGHGSHVASIAISSRNVLAKFNGMAPEANLVVVDAFGADGYSSYATVIHAIDWIVANKDSYGIRVLNCSFSAAPRSYYWDDPLNQAIMEAWRAGIVVVASAGNKGPEPMTIGVPGNLPYILTVGAMTDNYTPTDMTDDVLASFSSTGPTVEGFIKPDLVAPGGHVKALMKTTSQIAVEYPEFHDGGYYFNMSGTSQATAFVTGVVALMLQQNPQLTPDEVKYRLMATADPARYSAGSGSFAYSVFQQGAGLVDAYSAVFSLDDGTANRGLDVDADLNGTQRFRGTADAWTSTSRKKGVTTVTYTYYVADQNGDPLSGDGFEWAGNYFKDSGFAWSDGFVWNDAFAWSDAFMWSDGFVWSDGFTWSDAFVWNDGFVWNDLNTEALFTESWVPQE